MDIRLVQNALDFIISGAANARDAYEWEAEYDDAEEDEKHEAIQHSLKYAVLHLSAGAELLLKERLRHEHWSLLFERPDEATLETFASGDFRSVGFASLLKRLEGVAGVAFDNNARNLLESLKRQRNRLEHFEFRGNVEATRTLVNRVASFALDVIHRELSWTQNEEGLSVLVEQMRTAMFENEDFIRIRMSGLTEAIERSVGAFSPVIPCPSCQQEAFLFEVDGCRCLFCHEEMTSEDAAHEWQLNYLTVDPKERYDYLGACPECGFEEFTHLERILEARGEHVPGWMCFNCGFSASTGEISRCVRCSEPFVDANGVGTICRSCFSYVVSKDD